MLKSWHSAVHGVTKSWTQLSDLTELTIYMHIYVYIIYMCIYIYIYIYIWKRHKRYKFHPWGMISWRMEWLPTLAFLPGESHGQTSLEGYSLWVHKESDTTAQLFQNYYSK